MMRLKEEWHAEPGLQSALAKEEEVNNEGDWHDVFQRRMEAAGWTLKHEEVCNTDRKRVDFIGYHSDLNPSYEAGEWVGFELKYSDLGGTRAVSAAAQVEDRYRDKTWLSSGEEIDLWVIAPYVESSHSINQSADERMGHIPPAHKMSISRGREMESARFLNRLGYGYLFSWHTTPFISFRRGQRLGMSAAWPSFEEGFVNSMGVPAFKGGLDPFKVGASEYMCPKAAAEARVKHQGRPLTYDRDRLQEELEAAVPFRGDGDE